MSPSVRYVVAAVLLVFAWKGAALDISWPPLPYTDISGPAPDPQLLRWAELLKPILPKMLPADRKYLANFYDAMAYVLLKDGDRDQPIVATTDKFIVFHSNSLRLGIEKKNVGKYPGLGEAIDEVFFAAMGADPKTIDPDTRTKLVAACGVLSWTFSIHHE